MINAIKKLLSGILSFFVGLFGGKNAQAGKLNPANKPKKRSGYFMELDESEENGNLLKKIDPAAVVKQVQQTANTVAAQAKETVSNATQQAKEAANTVAGQSKEAANTVAGQSKEAANTVAGQIKETANTVSGQAKEPKSAKPVAATAKATTKTAEPVAQPKSKVELVQTAEGLKAEPIKNEPSVVAGSNGQSKTETTFAPKYLNPATASSSRRRPGANMSSFLDMANQVKPAKG